MTENSIHPLHSHTSFTTHLFSASLLFVFADYQDEMVLACGYEALVTHFERKYGDYLRLRKGRIEGVMKGQVIEELVLATWTVLRRLMVDEFRGEL